MPEQLSLIRRSIRLPPAGWALAGMLAFYVLAGLFGRDPWKGEDAIHIGTAWQMLSTGDWLTPSLAGRPFHEPPLFYWSAALTGLLFDWALPAHEAMRLASGIWIALALTGLYYAGRELYGTDSAAASPLLLAGCVGLLFHAHDAQPMLIALAAYAGGLGALATIGRKPRLTGIFYGLALAACLLGAGIAPTLPLLAIAPLAWWLSPDRRKAAHTLLIGLGIGIVLALPWPLALSLLQPARFNAWLVAELAPLKTPFTALGLGKYLALLPWFAFPVLPLAAWTLWSRRKDWQTQSLLLPLSFLLITLLLLVWAYRPNAISSLLLLPSLALLATPGALSLRRGAANAFDWFALSLFSFLALLVWVAWAGMTMGVPQTLANRIVKLRPGFSSELDLIGLLVGLAASLWWIWLMLRVPRSPYRSLVHWTMGFTTWWLMTTALILPWFDYGKSYRPVAEAIAAKLPRDKRCLAERNLNSTQLGSFSYFADLAPVNHSTKAGKACDWLIVAAYSEEQLASPSPEWTPVWQGNRPGERRERFRLYRR